MLTDMALNLKTVYLYSTYYIPCVVLLPHVLMLKLVTFLFMSNLHLILHILFFRK